MRARVASVEDFTRTGLQRLHVQFGCQLLISLAMEMFRTGGTFGETVN